MGIGDTAKNILSFGAYGRVKRKQTQFDDVRVQLEEAIRDLEVARVRANENVGALVAAKEDAVDTLKCLGRISKSFVTKDRSVGEADIRAVSVAHVAKIGETISNAELAKSAARGVTTAASTALGTWALVGAYGTASTGTAISGLSGVAASNAILAWLGGGSLAAGGGGMAAGAAVLGGIVLVPAAIIMAIFNHMSANRRIKEIEERVAHALAAIEQTRGTQLMLEGLNRRIDEVIRSIGKAQSTFRDEFKSAYRQLYPLGFLSRVYRQLRKLFGRKYFSDKDLEIVSPLLQIAAVLARLVDQRLLDKNGNIL
jgi:hypothetical protein